MNPRTNGRKLEDIELGVCGTRGMHATWRSFQDKLGRPATLNQTFKDKDPGSKENLET